MQCVNILDAPMHRTPVRCPSLHHSPPTPIRCTANRSPQVNKDLTKAWSNLVNLHFPTTGVWLPHNKSFNLFLGMTVLDLLDYPRLETTDIQPHFYRSYGALQTKIVLLEDDVLYHKEYCLTKGARTQFFSFVDCGCPSDFVDALIHSASARRAYKEFLDLFKYASLDDIMLIDFTLPFCHPTPKPRRILPRAASTPRPITPSVLGKRVITPSTLHDLKKVVFNLPQSNANNRVSEKNDAFVLSKVITRKWARSWESPRHLY